MTLQSYSGKVMMMRVIGLGLDCSAREIPVRSMAPVPSATETFRLSVADNGGDI
jgi:hypothetical protein